MIEVSLFMYVSGLVVLTVMAFFMGRFFRKPRRKPEDRPVEVATSDGYKSIMWNGQYWYSEGAVYYKSVKDNKMLHNRIEELVAKRNDTARKDSVDLAIESGARGSDVTRIAEDIYEYLNPEKENEK